MPDDAVADWWTARDQIWGLDADPSDIYPDDFTGTLPGDILTIGGQRYRVTTVTREHGVYTFDCEPADLARLAPAAAGHSGAAGVR